MVLGKVEGKCEGKKIEKKNKRKEKVKIFFLKFNKLFLYVSSNSFYLFFSIITRLNNLNIYKFKINFNHILFSFIFFRNQIR